MPRILGLLTLIVAITACNTSTEPKLNCSNAATTENTVDSVKMDTIWVTARQCGSILKIKYIGTQP